MNNSDMPGITKHQIILPKDHALSKLIIQEAHNEGHVGIEHVLAMVRKKYWIIRARPIIKSVLAKCLDCKGAFGYNFFLFFIGCEIN